MTTCLLLPLVYLLCAHALYAANARPLVIATDAFSPPFVMRGANNQLFGFDIEMMNDLCDIMHRSCQFKPMVFGNIFDTLTHNQADCGLSSITITLARSKQTPFSLPYLPSYAQYMGLQKWAKSDFSPDLLTHKTIGVEVGSIFKEAIEGVAQGARLIEYNNHQSLIQALQSEKIDFVLTDAFTAHYWQSQSDGILVALGQPFLYGYGFGIAVNPTEPELLPQLNEALLTYQNSGKFQKNYNMYLQGF